jgi:hypothetical protein
MAKRGAAYFIYGLGVAVWSLPLSECLKYIGMGYQLNKRVILIFLLILWLLCANGLLIVWQYCVDGIQCSIFL